MIDPIELIKPSNFILIAVAIILVLMLWDILDQK